MTSQYWRLSSATAAAVRMSCKTGGTKATTGITTSGCTVRNTASSTSEFPFERLHVHSLSFPRRSFWTLSGSPSLLKHASVGAICAAKGCTPAQAVFRIAQLHGITPLSGTTNERHMDDDVSAAEIDLDDVQSSVATVLRDIRPINV